jgi:hypothetical protein
VARRGRPDGTRLKIVIPQAALLADLTGEMRQHIVWLVQARIEIMLVSHQAPHMFNLVPEHDRGIGLSLMSATNPSIFHARPDPTSAALAAPNGLAKN